MKEKKEHKEHRSNARDIDGRPRGNNIPKYIYKKRKMEKQTKEQREAQTEKQVEEQNEKQPAEQAVWRVQQNKQNDDKKKR